MVAKAFLLLTILFPPGGGSEGGRQLVRSLTCSVKVPYGMFRELKEGLCVWKAVNERAAFCTKREKKGWAYVELIRQLRIDIFQREQ